MQVNDIVRHELHGYGLVLRVEGYDVEVRFARGKRELHPTKLKLAFLAAQAEELMRGNKLSKPTVLWLRATDPSLRSVAATGWSRITNVEHVLLVARTIESWPPVAKTRAIAALTAARLKQGMPPWAVTVADATMRIEESEAREAEREAARREASAVLAARRSERDELEELAIEFGATKDVPAAIHRRLLNHARRCRGELELDALEASQVVARMAHAALTRRRESWCWSCKQSVSTELNEQCGYCRWLACWWCGSCEVRRDDDGTPIEMCRATAWARPDISRYTDRDARGVPILTPQLPAVDADLIASLLTRAGIDRAFHWSPGRSTKSILRRGILSPQELDERGVPFVPHFYGSREKAALLWGYAALSFYPKFQMMESWSNSPAVFEVATDVLLTSGTLFVPGNSASSDFSATDLKVKTGHSAAMGLLEAEGRGPRHQAEAWIPRRVPRAAITRVFVHDQHARTELLIWLERRPDVPAPEVRLL